MDKKWLKKKLTIEECEKQLLAQIKELGEAPFPDIFEYPEWLKFKSQIQEGDELWVFSSSSDAWESLCGSAGICIVRNGIIIDKYVTVVS
jgi:hypothetical protein